MINCGYKAIPHSFLDHFHFMRGGAKLSFRPRFSLAKIFTYGGMLLAELTFQSTMLRHFHFPAFGNSIGVTWKDK